MQLTLTAHSLARALDVAAAPYRSLTPRPRENDPAAHIVLEATTEGLLCSGHGVYLSARTLADYSLTAPAGLDRMSPAMIPARIVRALAAALTESGGWATVCATPATVHVTAYGFAESLTLPNTWGLFPDFDPDAETPVGTAAAAHDSTPIGAPYAGPLAVLASTLARHVQDLNGLRLAAHPESPQDLAAWACSDWAAGTIATHAGPAGSLRIDRAAPAGRHPRGPADA